MVEWGQRKKSWFSLLVIKSIPILKQIVDLILFKVICFSWKDVVRVTQKFVRKRVYWMQSVALVLCGLWALRDFKAIPKLLDLSFLFGGFGRQKKGMLLCHSSDPIRTRPSRKSSHSLALVATLALWVRTEEAFFSLVYCPNPGQCNSRIQICVSGWWWSGIHSHLLALDGWRGGFYRSPFSFCCCWPRPESTSAMLFFHPSPSQYLTSSSTEQK